MLKINSIIIEILYIGKEKLLQESRYNDLSDQIRSDQSLSRVRLFAIPWIAACQASLSSPIPGVHWNSRPSSQWCHPAISSSVVPFSSCPRESDITSHLLFVPWVLSFFLFVLTIILVFWYLFFLYSHFDLVCSI